MRTKITLTALLLAALAIPSYAAVVESQIDPATLLKLEGGLKVYNLTGGTIAKGALVYVSGWTETNITRFKITKADADAGGVASFAVAVMRDACYTSTVCDAYSTYTFSDQNTNGLAVGDSVYLSTTAGGWTATAPTAANSLQQVVGRVRKVSSTVGIVELDLRHAPVIKFGSGQLQSGSVAPGSLGVTCRASTNIGIGDLVYISSYNATSVAQVCAVADADVANGQATYVALAAITSGSTGTVYKSGTVTMNTAASTVGNPVYLTITGTTTNTLSLAAPTGADDVIQIVGRVTVVNASGSVLIDLTANDPGVATNDIQDSSITAAKIATDAVGSDEIATDAVGSAEIVADAVTASEIATDAVGTAEIATDGVAAAEIAAGAVGTAELATVSVTPVKMGLLCGNASGGNYAAGDFVYISSHDATNPLCSLADADVANAQAQYVVTAACNTGTTCTVARSAVVTAVDTSAVGAVGDPLYLTHTGTTGNTWSASAPSAADDIVQIVARVTIDDAAGAFLVDFQSLPAITKITAAGIQDGAVVNAQIGAAAAIDRSKLAEDALAKFEIPIADLRTEVFGALTLAEDADSFNLNYNTNVITVKGEVTDNETETSIGTFMFRLPAEYVAAGDVKVRFRSELLAAAAPTNNGSTLDLSCYEQADGAVGGDIVSTAALTFTALDTFYNQDFSLTATDLVAGDLLSCKFTMTTIDSEAGGGTITFTSDPPVVLVDIKG